MTPGNAAPAGYSFSARSVSGLWVAPVPAGHQVIGCHTSPGPGETRRDGRHDPPGGGAVDRRGELELDLKWSSARTGTPPARAKSVAGDCSPNPCPGHAN